MVGPGAESGAGFPPPLPSASLARLWAWAHPPCVPKVAANVAQGQSFSFKPNSQSSGLQGREAIVLPPFSFLFQNHHQMSPLVTLALMDLFPPFWAYSWGQEWLSMEGSSRKTGHCCWEQWRPGCWGGSGQMSTTMLYGSAFPFPLNLATVFQAVQHHSNPQHGYGQKRFLFLHDTQIIMLPYIVSVIDFKGPWLTSSWNNKAVTGVLWATPKTTQQRFATHNRGCTWKATSNDQFWLKTFVFFKSSISSRSNHNELETL